MLPANIDLTEHRDFSDSPGHIMIIEPMDRDITDLVDLADGENMSVSEYEKLSQWRNIFGPRKHINQKRYVFSKEPRNGYRSTCGHCGKRIMPWDPDAFLGWCKQCRIKTSIKKYPWGYTDNSIMSVSRDLFNMR